MNSLQKRIATEIKGLGGLTQRPTLLAPVLYSPWGEPAAVAAMAAYCRSRTHTGQNATLWQATKKSLALFLTEQVLGRQLPEFILKSDSRGKPEIWLGAAPGPALSFSWSAGQLWAAVGRAESSLGLDAAAPEEFFGSYPYHRIFMKTEWETAMTLAAGDRPEAAALLWTVKEAAVKAEGYGFHLLSPKQVQVNFAGSEEQGYCWCVCLEGSHTHRRNETMAVSVRLDKIWLSVAWDR
jgi:phosphopantetheinyl transferase